MIKFLKKYLKIINIKKDKIYQKEPYEQVL